VLEPDDRVDDHVEIFVLRPARGTHDEADCLDVHSEPREQRLPVALAIAALDLHECRRGTVVEHMGVGHAEPALEKGRETTRHA
jgi:hypothetical protein